MTQFFHLPANGYRTMPWKNGRGATDEVWLWPEDADREDFSIRISRAPITDDGGFSAFEGADRVITLIEGRGLGLDFAEGQHRIAPHVPFQFDTGLAPFGRPLGGPVRVFNVMARRADWVIADARVTEEPAEWQGDLVVAFALAPQSILCGGEEITLAAQDTVVLRDPARVLATKGPVLVVTLRAA
ncbi:HutD family protein [Paracoccus cavernae]|uniref:HutD family protein n=1 Tax=Paracoccus cavernae TaxID=1571207 RepID=A0ABT8DEJ5_9RHOB|nr:HutD family protein [Paracoccus cavernae]